ncbi:MarR family winged helix-turn-helix transcriptional regulator [Asanoa sp. WMMD1127]|uniref:MarR family winged helix-turn-helix transcriptional regulator n=1 Tax=Asanoa sp. WMMD1127 TaxID=3016107 RepID=UPI002416DED5|nr:MarR family winged helix-turn-helix transcriptional regulator [Asanoa sp. WMMD1127]MDG4821830.1 MarR family winged helix-turn-helix transcriptional regulator [Asanoa sp. WMMD1127]
MTDVMRSAEVVGELMSITTALRRLSRRRTAEAVATVPLPEAQRELLFVVANQPGIGIAAAAATLGLAGNSVSTLVNQLVDGGLLHREPDPSDRRAARLTLTDKARDRMAAWRAARAALIGEALDRASPADRAAIAAALPALRRLLDGVRADIAEPGRAGATDDGRRR